MKYLLPLFVLLLGTAVFAAERPNIIIVLIDDMGWADLSCFGNNTVKTPNIDQLAHRGLRFTSFYVSAPICSPSRCGIITGQYPQRWNITSYLDNRQKNTERGVAQWLDLKAPAFPRLFHDAGYATGHFGKWHLGGQRDVGEAPLITQYGFGKSLTNFEGLGDRVLPLLQTFDGKEPRKYALGSDNLGHGTIRWADRHTVTGIYTEAALDFIKNAEQNRKAFFVNLWLDDVHSPFHPSNGKHTGTPANKKERYHQVLVETDKQLSPLFNYIQQSETLRNNTLILLLSDNGPEPGAGSAEPFRGFKGNLYEGGVRSPLIVWGGNVGNGGLLKSAGTNDTAIFTSIDFAPSLLKIAGIPVPDNIKFDGEDFSEVLLGAKGRQPRHKPVFWQRPPDRPGPKNEPFPDLALRWNEWKFLIHFDGSLPQLYDVVNDPKESDNLAEKQPQLVEQFREQLRQWRALFADTVQNAESGGLSFTGVVL
ncbi:MAG: sulfatase-like hydrolase/transferase [Planctomycetaceae bacterium]|jgi:uncharacterized sulfatase|nr:sulfatase-like hydrolase/transferase [Planctomycetaceae bacterium]